MSNEKKIRTGIVKVDATQMASKGVKRVQSATATTNVMYRPDYADQCYRMALLGLKATHIAAILNITQTTFNNWVKKYPRFAQAFKDGGVNANAAVALKLFERACGFEFDEEQLITVAGGRGQGSEVERHSVRKIVPPDVAAIKFWLTNRQKDLWRDKVETGITDNDGNDVDPLSIAASRLTIEVVHSHNKNPNG